MLSTLVASRLWLDFVNTDDVSRIPRADALQSFSAFVAWMRARYPKAKI